MVPTHHNVAVLQHCTSRLDCPLLTPPMVALQNKCSFKKEKFIFSSEVKWMTLFDPLNGPQDLGIVVSQWQDPCPFSVSGFSVQRKSCPTARS